MEWIWLRRTLLDPYAENPMIGGGVWQFSYRQVGQRWRRSTSPVVFDKLVHGEVVKGKVVIENWFKGNWSRKNPIKR